MKKLLLFLLMAANTLTFAMQEAPQDEKLPAELQNLWEFNRKISKRYDVQQVIQEIKEAYPRGRIDFKGRYIEANLEDSRENIIKKFKDKPWFSERKLLRPQFISEAHKDTHVQ